MLNAAAESRTLFALDMPTQEPNALQVSSALERLDMLWRELLDKHAEHDGHPMTQCAITQDMDTILDAFEVIRAYDQHTA